MAGRGRYREFGDKEFNRLDKDGFDAYMRAKYEFVRQKMKERELKKIVDNNNN